MKIPRFPLAALGLSLLACSGAPTVESRPVASAQPPAPPTATTTTTAEADSGPAAPSVPEIPMYPVAQIYSLCEVFENNGTIELRLGDGLIQPGSGILTAFRFVPVVNGVPALDQETEEVSFADSTGYGLVEIAGKRPNLMLHTVAGFRSSGSDYYRKLDDAGDWQSISLSAPGMGAGIYPWSKDRWLEMRVPIPDAPDPRAPKPFGMRVVLGTDKQAPSLPAKLAGRLDKDGFHPEVFRVSRAGMVMVIGTLGEGKKIGTLVWQEKLDDPAYFETEVPASDQGPDVRILGGATPEAARLSLNNEVVMKLLNGAWVEESKHELGEMPDVWFGSPILMSGPGGALVRTEAGGPWRPVGFVSPDAESHAWAMDAEGVVWKTEDDLLLSSKMPAGDKLVIDEKALVAARKASILRGGSDDPTGKPPSRFGERTCSTHYVLLDTSGAEAASDYPKIRKALTGHRELSKAKFIVTKEKGRVFFGAKVSDEKEAQAMVSVVFKATRDKKVEKLCADPPADREIKIDLATGNVIK